ncbi:hypothetical protein LZD49_02520 [Dyadobacter sp. CY261]|uniref:hypothetical protein n=1 Tax=Dyadobacter sp. CY261 TaxID=2907203 RepID=UPI001F1CA97D|nr:hypothetical protein [Dyadobacter sp. CY261]MCF0069328.1 hypothetical protein [Dyadobacter sp. CY261]
MTKWLQTYEYRIEIQWWVVPAAALAAISIALATVSFQAIKVACLNPAKTLRSE